jgi:hypothetical protein
MKRSLSVSFTHSQKRYIVKPNRAFIQSDGQSMNCQLSAGIAGFFYCRPLPEVF